MSQFDYIKNITRFALQNDQKQLKDTVRGLIDYSKKIKKHNFALELQAIVKENRTMQAVSGGDLRSYAPLETGAVQDTDLSDLILEKVSSRYTFDDLIGDENTKNDLQLLVKEQNSFEFLKKYELPVSNKLFLHGPSGCGKTLAAYVLAGELVRPVYVVNIGAIVSSKLGETSKNLSKLFRKASRSESILFFDEFDTLGKLRDYSQDHAEMKRVVNTFLQLFDYLPENVLLIAATNHAHVIDQALLRRFDFKLELKHPKKKEIELLIRKILKSGQFETDKAISLQNLVKKAEGLSYYSVQKTLIQAVKQSLFDMKSNTIRNKPVVDTRVWQKMIAQEQEQQKSLG
ncbi:MAG: AAA family ATPase [Balneolales bacterium]